MIDWDDIAIRLTSKWKRIGLLPREILPPGSPYRNAAYDPPPLEEIIYDPRIKIFKYLGKDGSKYFYDETPITKTYVMSELWNELSESERLEFTAEILGKK